jgi:hypothetical protein
MTDFMKRNSGIYLLLLAGMLCASPADAQRRSAPKKRTEKSTEKKTKDTKNKKQVQKPAAQKPAPARKPAEASRPIAGGNDTTLRSTTFEVEQIYKPEIKPAPKPELTPSMPPADVQRLTQQYEVPQQALYYTYRSLPVRPLALGKDTATPPPPNYVKAGGGNLSTLYADIGIASLKGGNWESVINAHHISQKGDITGQKFWHTGLDAKGTLHANGHAWTLGLDANYRKYGLYGYDHEIYNYDEDALKRVYADGALKFGVRNETEGLWGIDYAPTVSVNINTGTIIDWERTIAIDAPFSKKIDENLTVGLGIAGTFTHLKADTFSQENNIIRLSPSFTFRQEDFTAHFGLNPTFGRGGNTYLLPDITAQYVLSDRFLVKAGWQANLVQNTFQQMYLRNPFLQSVQNMQQTRTDEVFGGFEAGLGKHLSLNVRASWWQYNNLAIFRTAPLADRKSFIVDYDPKVNALSLQASLRYQVANTFSAGVSGGWYGFYDSKNAKVWNEPAIRVKGDVQWQLLKSLQLNAYLLVLDEIYGERPSGGSIKLDGVADLGIGAEYQLVPKLSLWLNVGNLLNRENERWMGYQGYGINIFGGLRFRF